MLIARKSNSKTSWELGDGGRIDYQWTSNHSVFGRYLVDSAVIPPGYDINKNLLAVAGNAGAGADGLSQAFTLGDTYLFSSNVVNALRLTANRFANVKTAAHLDGAGVGLGRSAHRG